jgi:hypothetical protein
MISIVSRFSTEREVLVTATTNTSPDPLTKQ